MNNRISINEIVDALAKRQNITKKKADTFTRAFFETIKEGLTDEKFVKIAGFGTFKVVTVEERESVNIRTGERFTIDSHDKISFTPDTQLKELVNRPFAHFQTTVLNDETSDTELEAVDEKVEEVAAPAAVAPLADLPKVPAKETKSEPAPKLEPKEDVVPEPAPKAEPEAVSTHRPTEKPAVVEEPKQEAPAPKKEEPAKKPEPIQTSNEEPEQPKKKRITKWFWIGIIIGAIFAFAARYFFFSNNNDESAPATEQVAAEPAPAADPEPAKPEGEYTIVVCDGVSEEGAKYVADKLRAEGIETEMQKKAKYYRLIYGRFETQTEGYQKYAELQKTNKAFKTSYVGKVN